MRAIIQRVSRAWVTVEESTVSNIDKGLCVLVGIHKDDTDKDIEFIVRKILNLRLFDDESEIRWKFSALQLKLPILCISQFTLYAVLKGNKPDFHQAMGPQLAPEFYNKFLTSLKQKYEDDLVHDGKFGAHMQVHIQNDGPVTIDIDSRNNKNKNNSNGDE